MIVDLQGEVKRRQRSNTSMGDNIIFGTAMGGLFGVGALIVAPYALAGYQDLNKTKKPAHVPAARVEPKGIMETLHLWSAVLFHNFSPPLFLDTTTTTTSSSSSSSFFTPRQLCHQLFKACFLALGQSPSYMKSKS
ncbi:hypothetical protein E2C01_029841 [Portunus trituberculatus]|uniref:Uncharacterized protein n=1 Tax=Portunus trituberculatus TaxID=210409 RepID=A0A5B7ESI8_PORTR|nr:hypothetical protein [Portunus trituberculatus]